MNLKYGLPIVFLVCSAASRASFVNASFEDPSLNPSEYTTNGILGWTTGSGIVGVGNIAGLTTDWDVPAPDGSQVGFTNGPSVSQVSGLTFGQGINTLDIFFGRRKDGIQGDATVELWAGGTADTGNITGGTLIQTLQVPFSTLTLGNFTNFQLSVNLASGDANIGQTMGVRIVKDSGVQVLFDDVRLSSPVPEPGTILAVTSGVALLLRRRRTRV
jgi:hypothetical protein